MSRILSILSILALSTLVACEPVEIDPPDQAPAPAKLDQGTWAVSLLSPSSSGACGEMEQLGDVDLVALVHTPDATAVRIELDGVVELVGFRSGPILEANGTMETPEGREPTPVEDDDGDVVVEGDGFTGAGAKCEAPEDPIASEDGVHLSLTARIEDPRQLAGEITIQITEDGEVCTILATVDSEWLGGPELYEELLEHEGQSPDDAPDGDGDEPSRPGDEEAL